MKKILLFIVLLFLGIVNVNASVNYVDYMSKNIVSNSYDRTQARYLQKELNMVMGCNLDTDGIVGNLTKNCVKNFQRAYGLVVDGLVGNATRTKLNYLYGEDKVIVTANTLNIRNNPSTIGTTILGRVTKGNILTVLSVTNSNNKLWYYIRYNGIYGYVISDYVRSTFVEVDIISQTLRLYKDSKLILDTPVTTGKADGQHDTNKGFFYALGIHDANWRGSTVNYNYFGGTVYKSKNGEAGMKTTGSHGCVNVPVPKMPIIYANVSASWTNTTIATPVYVH